MLRQSLFCLLLCVLAVSARAADPLDVYPQQPEKLCIDKTTDEAWSLLDVMTMAICRNPSLKHRFLATRISAAQYGQSLSNYFPTLNGAVSVTPSVQKQQSRSSRTSTDLSAQIALNLLLLDFGARGAQAAQMQAYLAAAQSTYDSSLQQLLYDVSNAYYSVLSSQENYAGLQKSEEASKKAQEEARSRFKIGLVPKSDVLQAETAYAQARLASEVAKKNIQLKKGALAQLLSMAPDTPFTLEVPAKKIVKEKEFDDFNSVIDTAFAQRPDLQAAWQNVSAAQEAITAAQSDGLPSVSATARAGVSDDLKSAHDTTYNAAAGLTLNVPLFTGFQHTYKVEQAEAAYAQAQEELERLKNTVQKEVWDAIQNYRTFYTTHQISKTLLRSAEESEKVAFASYKVGKINILSLLEAQTQLANARIEYNTSFYNFLITKADVLRTLGQMEQKK